MRSVAPEVARYLALPDEQAPLKFFAVKSLARWRCREGIEWLIERVDGDASAGGGMRAIRILGPATGVNFFSDKERWRDWWRVNEERFPSAAEVGGKR